MSGTSWADIGSGYSVTKTGLYFVTAKFNQNGNPGGTSFILHSRINMGSSTGEDVSVPSVANYAGNHNAAITYSRMAWVTSGSSIKIQGRTENWSGGVGGVMEVTRIY